MECLVSPEALIIASVATAAYMRNPQGGFAGSVGTLIGSGWMAHKRNDWRRTAGIIGTALSGAAIGAQLTAYYIFKSFYEEIEKVQNMSGPNFGMFMMKAIVKETHEKIKMPQ